MPSDQQPSKCLNRKTFVLIRIEKEKIHLPYMPVLIFSTPKSVFD